MAGDASHASHIPVWAVNPNDTDVLAWGALIVVGAAVYFIIYLYAKFDHWAEHKAEGTILAKTIPTMLSIALLYEVFPLDHFSILLPLAALLIAVMTDLMVAQAKYEPAAAASDTGPQESIPAAMPKAQPEKPTDA